MGSVSVEISGKWEIFRKFLTRSCIMAVHFFTCNLAGLSYFAHVLYSCIVILQLSVSHYSRLFLDLNILPYFRINFYNKTTRLSSITSTKFTIFHNYDFTHLATVLLRFHGHIIKVVLQSLPLAHPS